MLELNATAMGNIRRKRLAIPSRIPWEIHLSANDPVVPNAFDRHHDSDQICSEEAREF
jgi:hypothetical protein